jgi:predicted metal-dependent enzyme (double-stranded beta helix superfamily)
MHVYGANIGAEQRHVYDENNSMKAFVSRDFDGWIPNLWMHVA